MRMRWVLLPVCALLPGTSTAAPPPGAVPFEITVVPAGKEPPRAVVAWERDGSLYLGANEFSAILGWTKFWRPDLGRLILSGPQHRITLIEGTDLAVVDDGQLLHLPGPVFLWEGQMMLPLDLMVDEVGEPRPWVETSLAFSRNARRLRLGGEKPSLRDVKLSDASGGWELRLTSTARLRYEVISRDRSEFALRLLDVSYDPLLLPLPTEHPWFQGLRIQPSGRGVEVRFTPGPGAAGYRISLRDTSTVTILLGFLPGDLAGEALNPFGESHAILPRFQRVALDPGHGGDDRGDAVPGGKESDLAWDLAKRVQSHLENTGGMLVFLTRARDESPGPERRADLANRVEADVFLSLHLHSRSGGPQAFLVSGGETAASVPGVLDDLGFRAYGAGGSVHDAESRVVAVALLEAIAEALGVPARGVRAESIPELAGVAMPGVLLEFGTVDGAKWTDARLESLAEAIALGLERAPSLGGDGR